MGFEIKKMIKMSKKWSFAKRQLILLVEKRRKKEIKFNIENKHSNSTDSTLNIFK